MAVIPQKQQKRLILIVAPQLIIANGSGFVKKMRK